MIIGVTPYRGLFFFQIHLEEKSSDDNNLNRRNKLGAKNKDRYAVSEMKFSPKGRLRALILLYFDTGEL